MLLNYCLHLNDGCLGLVLFLGVGLFEHKSLFCGLTYLILHAQVHNLDRLIENCLSNGLIDFLLQQLTTLNQLCNTLGEFYLQLRQHLVAYGSQLALLQLLNVALRLLRRRAPIDDCVHFSNRGAELAQSANLAFDPVYLVDLTTKALLRLPKTFLKTIYFAVRCCEF